MNRDDGIVPGTGASGARDAAAGKDGGAQSAVTVGERLAAARVAKGRSVEEMASRLKVAPAKVQALESGNLAVLHDAAFAVGLARSYAKVLGIDPDPLMDTLRGVRNPTTDLSALPGSTPKPASTRRANVPLSWSTRRSDRRSWIWGGLAAFVVLVLLMVWRAGNEPNGWLQRFKGEARTDAAMANPATASQVEANPDDAQASSGAVVSTLPNPSQRGESPAAEPAQSATQSATQSGSPSVNIPAGPGAAKSSSQAATLAAVSSPATVTPLSALSAGTPAGTAATPSTTASAATAAAAALPPGAVPVTISATQDSWVNVVQADGKSVFSGIVRSGQTQQFSGVRPLRFVIGNVHGISAVTQSGQAVDLAPYKQAGHNVARLTLR